MKRRNFLAKTSAGVGGLLLTRSEGSAASGQTTPPAPQPGNGPNPCMAQGPMGQVLNLVSKNISLLPPQRLTWDGVEARLAVQDDARCQRPTGQELAMRGPECGIQEILNLDTKTTFQEMLGFGGTIIDSDVWNLTRLTPEKRRAAITALAGKDGLGFNLMRIAFGSSDWNRDANFYTYCDVPAGETDPKLTRFSVQRDVERGIIDVLREFRTVNPDLQILASVWGVPAWMTSNKSIMHGFFDSAFTEIYADYLTKSVQAYAALGIPIQYLTVQNEPATGADRSTPAAMWTWEQQRDVLLALGERFARNRIDTKLWLMDHNFDMAQTVAKPLLDDPRVKRIAHMVAFHDYRGRPEEMALLGQQHPDVPAVMSEHSRGSIRDLGRLVDVLVNGATGHISWTTVTDEWGGPYQYGGGSGRRPASTDYEKTGYIMVIPQREDPPAAHRTVVYCGYQTFSSLIQRGARRIASNPLTRLDVSNAAFRNPDGSVVLIVVNRGGAAFDMAVQRERAALLLNMPANAILSLRFKA
ncbi:MAG: glycoside hydrolase family 30 beta sandwich domain-containing protein [Bryobacteraceae bacterium]